MRISELITKLNQIKETHGDLCVDIDSSYGEFPTCDIQRIEADSENVTLYAEE